MKTIRNATKLYLKELREHYSIAHLFQAITIICAVMLAVDYYDLPSKLMNAVPVFIGLVTLISAVLVTMLWLREINCCDLVKIPSPNAVDICVIRMLWDCIGTSLGAVYMYAVDESRLNLLALNKDQIDNMLVSIPPRNESEEFVYSVYQLYKTEGTDARGEKSVKRTVAIAPIL